MAWGESEEGCKRFVEDGRICRNRSAQAGRSEILRILNETAQTGLAVADLKLPEVRSYQSINDLFIAEFRMRIASW
jgi:hypothetical protein